MQTVLSLSNLARDLRLGIRLLATIGLYGVMAYSASQRTSEFGIRMAPGAQRADMLRIVFLQGSRLIAFGLVLGLVGSLLLTNTLSSLLFDVRTNDPLALSGVAILLALVAAVACLVLARRAAQIDPMIALHAE